MQTDEMTAPELATPPELKVRVRPRPATETKPKVQPPYAVILHNDSVNGIDWVVGVLVKVLRCGAGKATWLTVRTHVTGRCPIWSGSKEVAELKAEQIQSCGSDPRKPTARPLKVSIEPLPQ